MDRFDVDRVAGAGGMGTVYRARDRETGETVALKLLHADGAEETKRFVREATLLADLAHPGIVRHVAHGVSSDGVPWLAMAWLEGCDLATALARGPTPAQSVALVLRAAEILGAAHARGIVHRDVKPSNLFLEGGRLDRVLVLDFGVAHRDDWSRATRTGTMLGTPAYMSPEQAKGERGVDARTDVYALGCVLFECLTGRPPLFADTLMALLAKVLLEEPPRASELRPGIPAALDDLVLRCLSKRPDDRPRDGADLAAALAALGEVADLPPAPAKHAPSMTPDERRLLSVVLLAGPADAGIDLSRTLTPEEDAAALAALRSVAKAYGGDLEGLADGSVVVTIAGSGPATDQAARAARAALALHAIASATPIALVTGFGEISGRWPVGPAVERAAALVSRAGAEVRLDDETAGLLAGRFLLRRDPDGTQLIAERSATEGPRSVLGVRTPCVGRDRELRVLHGLWEECAAEPASRAVLVVAPPGVGKSRLRTELAARIEAAGPCEIWIGRADPVSAGSPFAMLAPAIRGACGVRDSDPAAVRTAKVRTALPGPQAAFLGELCGVPFPDGDDPQLAAARRSPILLGDRMRAAWEDFVRARTGRGPVLLVLEDLQWGDLPTVAYVDAALRALADSPLMVLGLARPEVEKTFPRLWADRRVQEIRLDPIGKRAGAELVRAVLPDAAADVVSRIVDRAAGNAFFLEELLRAAAAGSDTPGSVLAMLHARLERLPAEARLVLRAASVFGEVAWTGGVAALVGEAVDDVRRRLSDLAREEFLVERPDARFAGETEWTFRHGLVRDAAAATLTDKGRAIAHALAAEWLISAGETDAVVLAEHFERGGVPLRAVPFWRRAAQAALEGNDFDAVVARAARCAACGATGEDKAASRLLEAEAERWRGRYPEAENAATEAMALATRESDAWYRAITEVALALGWQGKGEGIEALAKQLLDSDPPRSPAAAGATARVAAQCLHSGRAAIGGELLARVDESVTLGPLESSVLDYARAVRSKLEGDLGAYSFFLDRAAASAESVGDIRTACSPRVNLGYALCEVGDHGRAEGVLKEALAIALRVGLAAPATASKNNLGLALGRLGRIEEAIEVEQQAVTEAAGQGAFRIEGVSRGYLAWLLALAGRMDDAESEARRAVSLLDVAPPLRPEALATLARILLLRGSHAEALAVAKTADEALDSMPGVNAGESSVRLVRAEAEHAAGNAQAARDLLARARDQLLERAARIGDERMRGTFLQAVPENARTLDLHREWTAVAAGREGG